MPFPLNYSVGFTTSISASRIVNFAPAIFSSSVLSSLTFFCVTGGVVFLFVVLSLCLFSVTEYREIILFTFRENISGL